MRWQGEMKDAQQDQKKTKHCCSIRNVPHRYLFRPVRARGTRRRNSADTGNNTNRLPLRTGNNESHRRLREISLNVHSVIKYESRPNTLGPKRERKGEGKENGCTVMSVRTNTKVITYNTKNTWWEGYGRRQVREGDVVVFCSSSRNDTTTTINTREISSLFICWKTITSREKNKKNTC